MYTDFCANQPKLTTALDRLQKNPAFAAFLAQCMTNEECRGLTLFSFLIKPIQRICKYPLLLKDLLKHTPSAHSDYEKLESALQKIECVVSYDNERKRIAENLQKIIDVKDQIESTEVCFSFLPSLSPPLFLHSSSPSFCSLSLFLDSFIPVSSPFS